MKEVTRIYTFRQKANVADRKPSEFVLRFVVIFTHTQGDTYTRIHITPSVGPVKTLRYRDVGVTWGSIFFGYRWCAREAYDTFLVWTEMDTKVATCTGPLCFDGEFVIPEKKLSTSKTVLADA